MIGVRNMADFVARCVSAPGSDNQTFVVRDGSPVSTRELIETIAREAGKPARLVRVPPRALRAAGAMTGRGDMVRRLIGDYRIDDGKARSLIGWTAPQPLSFDMGRLVRALRS
jgi:UDP-glucose 4-epimerase